MATKAKKKNGKTAKEIEEITNRLYGTTSGKTQHKNVDQNGSENVLTKEQIDNCIGRLFEKDPDAKRKELESKHNQNFDRTRPDNYGWQKQNSDDVNAITSRLFVADYTNRFVGKEESPKSSDKKMTKEEYDAVIERLHIQNYTNKNITKNKEFYDQILNKKKAQEKVLSKEEFDEAVTRLSKVTRDPASCNKEMLGEKTFKEKGIYGTYALNNRNKEIVKE